MKSYHKFLWLFLVSLGFGSCSQMKNEMVAETMPQKSLSTSSGMSYEILRAGRGEVARAGQQILIHERMHYLNGELIFSSRELGHPIKLLIGGNQAIDGIDEGVRGMQVGEIRKLIVPPAMSKRTVYPSTLSPDSSLLYEIELIEILPGKVGAEEEKAILYRSTDQGRSWSSFAKGMPAKAAVSGFATKGTKVFAITDYHGVFVIEKGANEWTPINQGLPDQVDINTIVVIDNTVLIGTYRHGIYRSTDDGQTWNAAGMNAIDQPLRSIVDWKETSIRCFVKQGAKLLVGTDYGIYESLDKGKNWTTVFEGTQINGFTVFNEQIYAAVVQGVLISKDGGASWASVYQGQTIHNLSSDARFVYAMEMGGGLLRSNDEGRNWEAADTGMDASNLYTFDLKSSNKELFAVNHQGIYQSTDFGNQWILLQKGLPVRTVFSSLAVTDIGLLAGTILERQKK